jgi:hypothetical protein
MIPAIKDLTDYLLTHEDDIALCINDFGTLKSVFELMFDRSPLSEEDKNIMKGKHVKEIIIDEEKK